MLILGVLGRSASGKSTVAKAIVKEANAHGLTAGIFEFSHYVLTEAIYLNLIPEKERKDLTPAEIESLVKLGVEMREKTPWYWAQKLFEDVEIKNFDVSVVGGVRFLNEAEEVRKRGGSLVRVQALLTEGIEYISRDRDPNHSSEIENYSIHADFFLTTLRGQSILLAKQAATLFNYLYSKG
jgi:ABC-type dipeptide/oligopeptide/nickel transport system ATPase component